MLSKLDALAKPYELAPGVVIRILPFKPLYWIAMQTVFNAYLEKADIPADGVQQIFILVTPLITSVTVAESAQISTEMRAFTIWFQERTTDIVESWQLFQQFVSISVATMLWEASEAIQDDLPKAAPELQQPAPVPVDENGNPTNPI